MADTVQGRAKAARKTGRNRQAFSLAIAGRPVNRRAMSATATYSVGDANGTSEMEIVADTDLSRFEGDTAELRVGWGEDLYPWFAGEVEEPDDDHEGEGSEAVAWGPSKTLADQSFSEQVSYGNQTLEYALLDIHGRAGMPPGSVEIRRGSSFVISPEAGTFARFSPLADAADALLASATFVGTDLPGFRRLYRPKPRLRADSAPDASYDEGSYPRKAFSAVPSRRNYFSSVVVFRRNSEGTGFDFPPVEMPVEPSGRGRSKPKKNRRYVVSDFAGSELEAIRQAAQLARLLSRGTFACSLTGIAANPSVLPFATVHGERTERRDAGGRTRERYLVSYAFSVDGEASLTVSREGDTMEVSGAGVKLSEKLLPKPFYLRPARGSYVVPGGSS